MTRILTVDDAWDGQWIGIDGIGRRSVLARALPASAVAPAWSDVLTAGNTTGGTNAVISVGDQLSIDGAGAIRASPAGGIAIRIGGVDKLRTAGAVVEVGVPTLQFVDGVTPQIIQDGSSGADLSIVAQEGTVAGGRLLLHAGNGLTGAGGDLVVTPGTGGGGAAQGSLLIRHANNDIAMRVSQAAAHLGTQAINVTGFGLGFFDGTPTTRPIVAGAKGGNAALTSLLGVLDAMGLITDNTT
jgi:hypothetical protein